jgi:mycothiol synthase
MLHRIKEEKIEMTVEMIAERTITIAKEPNVPGLTFRGFRGEADYPWMLDVIEGSKEADGTERTDSLEDIARNYQHLHNCDPYQDMVFAEVDGEVVGYGRVWWSQTANGKRIYSGFAFLEPAWRDKGIRRAMLRHNEHRLRQIAAGHPQDGERWLEAWASDTEEHWESLLVDEGYEGVRWGFEMVRSDLENIPDLPLPEGLEVRPVPPEHYRAVFDAAKEAFRDSWEYSVDWFSEEDFQAWQQESTFQPELWQVAWDGDQVAGMVQNFVNEAENEEYGRQRGYTEGICVRRPWRRRGLARALIARSFQVIKELGMTEAALGVDAENPSGALHLYKSMGFKVVKRHTTYRKPLD